MEVRIGVQNSTREVVIESAGTADQIAKAVQAALSSGENLILTDEKGRQVIVPANALAYVDIAAPEARRVGFGG
mgnify:CR=1 FL=1